MATETKKEIRKGIKLYIDYFENEFAELTDEELGILIRGLYQYDSYNKLNSEYEEKINRDKFLRTLFKILMKNNDRAVAEWERIRKNFAKKNKKNNYDFDENESENKKTILRYYHIFEVPFSIELPEYINFTNEELEEYFGEIEAHSKYEPDMFKQIVNLSFQKGIVDDFKNPFNEYFIKAKEETEKSYWS